MDNMKTANEVKQAISDFGGNEFIAAVITSKEFSEAYEANIEKGLSEVTALQVSFEQCQAVIWNTVNRLTNTPEFYSKIAKYTYEAIRAEAEKAEAAPAKIRFYQWLQLTNEQRAEYLGLYLEVMRNGETYIFRDDLPIAMFPVSDPAGAGHYLVGYAKAKKQEGIFAE